MTICSAIVVVIGINSTNNSGELTTPLGKVLTYTKADQAPSPSSTDVTPNEHVPKTFKFDRSTDLKAELDKVNPQLLDSDFQ